jgi:carboxylate-amine ligase
MTVGIEEEVMLLHPTTLDLEPRAVEVLARVDGDPRFKHELVAAALEALGGPADTVAEAAAQLRAARHDLAAAADGIGVLAAAGVHPFAAHDGPLNVGAHYEAIAAEYGIAARTQLVFGLHIHVAVRGADRALAVYNALREHLPDLAALAANGPFYLGRDRGLASVRPKIAALLPRQGIPPAFPSWEHYAEALRWGIEAELLPGPGQWWWEARPHPTLGTIEVRAPDSQTTIADTAAVAAVVHALCARLAERFDAGELGPPAPTWRIAENRWSACRHGVDGWMVDVETGARTRTRARLASLIDELEPYAATLGCVGELDDARRLLQSNGASRLRAAAGRDGVHGAVEWLVARFLEP